MANDSGAITEQRKLAAILFTDVVGYSALSQRNDKFAQKLLEEHVTCLQSSGLGDGLTTHSVLQLQPTVYAFATLN